MTDCQEELFNIYCNDDNKDKSIRKDLQILRSIAVLLVFFYHIGIHKWVFGSGLIGVDIFFVISGYLVVGIVLKDERLETFSFLTFYSRRIKRLFIPSIICLLFILTCTLIFPIGYKVYNDISAASMHYINYYFIYGETNYFKTSSSDSIVLHYWSLSLEEQFYFLLPILIGSYKLLFPLDKIWIYLILIWCISLLLIVFLPPIHRFFSLFSRIWEFISGALVYEIEYHIPLLSSSSWIQTYSKFIQLSCIVVLIVLSFILPVDYSWPNIYTLLVVFVTSIFILFKSSIYFTPLEMIGDWSYSIYLYHYPIIKFLQSIYNLWITTLLSIVYTLITSIISYYCIEKVHRINKWTPYQWFSFYLSVSFMVGITCLYIDLKIHSNPIIINLGNNSVLYDPSEQYNYSIFEEGMSYCAKIYTDINTYFWGPGYRLPSYKTSDLVIEIKGRPDYCIIVVGNSRSRHYMPIIKVYVNITNSTLYDGCTHADYRYSNISNECKYIITFIGDDKQGNEDINYFSKIGYTIKFVSSPEWFFIFKEREKDILDCIKKNTVLGCSIPWTNETLKEQSYINGKENISIIDFTDDFCSNKQCHLNIGNQLVTYDAWHLCPGVVLKLWPKFLSFMNGLEIGRKFIIK